MKLVLSSCEGKEKVFGENVQEKIVLHSLAKATHKDCSKRPGVVGSEACLRACTKVRLNPITSILPRS